MTVKSTEHFFVFFVVVFYLQIKVEYLKSLNSSVDGCCVSRYVYNHWFTVAKMFSMTHTY